MVQATELFLNSEHVRAAYPVLQEVTYFNVGTYGIMPEPALELFQHIQAEFERKGVASGGVAHKGAEEARKKIAALIGAEPNEITFTRNATDGINLVLAGLDWQPGDEIVITDEEHEAIYHPSMYLHKQKGLKINRLMVSADPHVMLQRLNEVYNEKIRLVALSLVSCETGTRLPAQEISAWAAERHVLCLFDGAQASGAIPVNVREIDCDFYASNGHKWLSGPKGTGFFYSKLDKLQILTPAHVGAGSLESVDVGKDIAEPFVTGQRFEFGTRAWPVYAGLKASLEWFETLGWESVYNHIAHLSAYLKSRILHHPNLTLITPQAYNESSGLVSFIVEGHSAGEISTGLRQDHKIYTRVIPHYNALRISTAHFNNTSDVDYLIDSLNQLLKD